MAIVARDLHRPRVQPVRVRDRLLWRVARRETIRLSEPAHRRHRQQNASSPDRQDGTHESIVGVHTATRLARSSPPRSRVCSRRFFLWHRQTGSASAGDQPREVAQFGPARSEMRALPQNSRSVLLSTWETPQLHAHQRSRPPQNEVGCILKTVQCHERVMRPDRTHRQTAALASSESASLPSRLCLDTLIIG